MSLINQMLKDLDARHEGDTRGRLHREVRALPEVKENRGLRLAIVALLILALSAAAWWGLEHFERLDQHAETGAGLATLPAAPTAAAPVPVAAEPGAITASVSTLSATASAPPAALAVAAPTVVASEAPALGNSPAVATSAAAEPAPSALDSALKLSPVLDKVPENEMSVPKPAPKSAPVTKPSSTPASIPKHQPSPPVAIAATAPAAPRVAAPLPLSKSAAPGGVDKTPVARTARERSELGYRQAVTLVNGSRIPEATDALLEVLRQDGGHVASRQLLARLLIEQRRNDEAMAILAEGLASQPGQIVWAMTLARLQVDRGDFAGAARSLQQSQPFASGNADYQGFAGHVQLRLGHPKESIEFYQAAVRIAPSEGRWWLGLGLALEADHRQPEAREALQRARASGTLNADLLSVVDQKLR